MATEAGSRYVTRNPNILSGKPIYLDHQTEINGYIEQHRIPDAHVHPSVKALFHSRRQHLPHFIPMKIYR